MRNYEQLLRDLNREAPADRAQPTGSPPLLPTRLPYPREMRRVARSPGEAVSRLFPGRSLEEVIALYDDGGFYPESPRARAKAIVAAQTEGDRGLAWRLFADAIHREE